MDSHSAVIQQTMGQKLVVIGRFIGITGISKLFSGIYNTEQPDEKPFTENQVTNHPDTITRCLCLQQATNWPP